MPRRFRVFLLFPALVLGAFPLSGFAADPPQVDLSANAASIVTGFADVEANYWITPRLSIGFVAGVYVKGISHLFKTEEFNGRGIGVRMNWVYARDCSRFCLAGTARYLYFNRMQIRNGTFPADTYAEYSTSNLFFGFGGMWTYKHLILKAFIGPSYWNNPADISAPQSSSPLKRISAADHGLEGDVEILVGVNF